MIGAAFVWGKYGAYVWPAYGVTLAGILAADWDAPIREKHLEQYAHSTLQEVDAATLLVAAARLVRKGARSPG